MSTTISTARAAAWLDERDNFLILTHRRPDGDTLGCAGALAKGLTEHGKTAYILYNPEITPRYLRFVEDCIAPDDFSPEYVISVDTATVDLFPKISKKYEDSVSLCIDHHKSNTFYAELSCLDAGAASCGEIVYDILIALSGSISSTVAERLYVALSTDTGCFAFGNTTAKTLRTASFLIEAGAPHVKLNKQLFRTKTRSRLEIEGILISQLEYMFDGKVAIATITRDMMEATGAGEDDLDDIAAIPGSVEGVCVGITIRELSSVHDCKISVRTRASHPYDAGVICAHFGGGGHKLAAGSSINKTADEVKQMLFDLLSELYFTAK